MRLTLRTLLAYMDNILDPADAREIAHKVEDSDFAKKLMQRLEDVMRRARLAAPRADDHGSLDPNTVAEYLDNVLPDDRVVDFEKICLESDVELSEVGACHQILALVLGEPVEVDPQTRQRVYQLQEGSPETPAAPLLATPPALPTIEPARRPREKPSIPDYFRDPQPRRRRLLPIAGCTALVVIVGLGVLAWLKPRGPDASAPPGPAKENAELAMGPTALGPESSSAAVPGEPASSSTAADAPGVATAPMPPGPAGQAAGETERAPLPPANVLPGSPPAAHPAEPAPAPSPLPVTPAPAAGTPTAPVPATAAPTAPAPASGLARESGPAAGQPAEPAPLPLIPGTPAAPMPGAKTETPPAAAEPAPESRPQPAEPAPLPTKRMGTLVSSGQVLLQRDPGDGGWTRVPAQAGLNSGMPLLALPAFQPMLFLNVGVAVQTQMLGGTELTLLPNDAQDMPGMDLAYGRVTLRPAGDSKGGVRIKVEQRLGVLRFNDSDTAVAVDLSRTRRPGADPEAQPGPLKCTLYAVSGEFSWLESADGTPLEVPAPGMLVLDEALAPRSLTARDLPKWLQPEDPTWQLDRRIAPTIEAALQGTRSVALGLRELTDHRQKEVAWLATRCRSSVGDFEPMVTALNNSDQSRLWEDCILQLQAAIDRGPAWGAAVRRAFERQYRQDGDGLYRILWGYDDLQLKAGQAAGLVASLDNDVLAYRVLASHCLEKLTGRGFSYRPSDPPSKRAGPISRWKERLEGGLITTHPGDMPDKPGATPSSGSLF